MLAVLGVLEGVVEGVVGVALLVRGCLYRVEVLLLEAAQARGRVEAGKLVEAGKEGVLVVVVVAVALKTARSLKARLAKKLYE